MEFIGVIPKDLATGVLWPQIRKLVAQALPYGRGEYEVEDIRDGIRAGQAFALGVIGDGMRLEFVAVATIAQYPRKRVLYVQYGAGEGGARAKPAIEAAARTLECDWVETRCRESVARLFRQAGFETGYHVCILETQQ